MGWNDKPMGEDESIICFYSVSLALLVQEKYNQGD